MFMAKKRIKSYNGVEEKVKKEFFMNEKLKCHCMIHKPYPEIKPTKKDPAFASLLSVPYAGSGGEISSILSYLYGSTVLDGSKNQTVSDVLRYISDVEMHHMNILAELIFRLGGDPKYAVAQGRRPFTAANMHYSENPAQILKSAVAGEESAIYVYEQLQKATEDENIIAVLERIIEDERLHLGIFRELLGEN